MTVALTVDGGVATVELRRPDRHNAFDGATKDAFARAVDTLARTPPAELRCVVVRGAGASFSSGADLHMLRSLDADGARRFMVEATLAFRALGRLPVPVIAAVRGHCLGGGLELALHCDVIVAADDASFGLPEVPLGLVTTAGSVERLAAAVGTTRARDLLLTGRRLPAVEAERIGLVAQVVAAAALDEAVGVRARTIVGQPREGIAAMKALLARRVEAAESASWIAELEAFEALLRARR